MILSDLKIESPQLHDLDRVAEIELESGLSRWGKQNYLDELKRADSLFYVARDENNKNKEGNVTGFVAARLIIPDVEIINIAVAAFHRKKGIGKLLLQKILIESQSRNCESCWLEVRESNHGARQFYSRLGFLETGRRRRYYSNPPEDAILLNFDFRK